MIICYSHAELFARSLSACFSAWRHKAGRFATSHPVDFFKHDIMMQGFRNNLILRAFQHDVMKQGFMPSAHGPISCRKKNPSENRFVCADFCSDIKSLRSFPGAVYDKKSVRVRSYVIQQWDLACDCHTQ